MSLAGTYNPIASQTLAHTESAVAPIASLSANFMKVSPPPPADNDVAMTTAGQTPNTLGI